MRPLCAKLRHDVAAGEILVDTRGHVNCLPRSGGDGRRRLHLHGRQHPAAGVPRGWSDEYVIDQLVFHSPFTKGECPKDEYEASCCPVGLFVLFSATLLQ
jgi:hypothetical protein